MARGLATRSHVRGAMNIGKKREKVLNNTQWNSCSLSLKLTQRFMSGFNVIFSVNEKRWRISEETNS